MTLNLAHIVLYKIRIAYYLQNAKIQKILSITHGTSKPRNPIRH